MSFDSLAASASALVLSTFGTDGTYHSLSEGEVSLGVVIDRNVDMEDSEGVVVQQDVASIKSGLLKPSMNDLLVVNGERWKVGQVLSDDGHILKLAVRRVL